MTRRQPRRITATPKTPRRRTRLGARTPLGRGVELRSLATRYADGWLPARQRGHLAVAGSLLPTSSFFKSGARRNADCRFPLTIPNGANAPQPAIRRARRMFSGRKQSSLRCAALPLLNVAAFRSAYRKAVSPFRVANKPPHQAAASSLQADTSNRFEFFTESKPFSRGLLSHPFHPCAWETHLIPTRE